MSILDSEQGEPTVLKHYVTVVAFVAIASVGSTGAQPARPEGSKQDEHVEARYNIFVMEGVLERAVKHGADQLRRQVQKVMPDMLLLSGEAEARGFRLDGYGVFFDVSVPLMRQSVAWSLRTMIQENTVAAGAALRQLKAAIERMTPDATERATLMQAIKRLEMQVTPQPGYPPGGLAWQAAERAPQPQPGNVTSLEATPAPPPARPTGEALALLEDPNGAYEREVIGALKDAMLNHSVAIRIGPDEWLTVAAHDNEQRNRLMPGEAYDLMTIVLRVKGSDLAAFRADRITLEEARKRVLVSEF
jgi:hypothetical protein